MATPLQLRPNQLLGRIHATPGLVSNPYVQDKPRRLAGELGPGEHDLAAGDIDDYDTLEYRKLEEERTKKEKLLVKEITKHFRTILRVTWRTSSERKMILL